MATVFAYPHTIFHKKNSPLQQQLSSLVCLDAALFPSLLYFVCLDTALFPLTFRLPGRGFSVAVNRHTSLSHTNICTYVCAHCTSRSSVATVLFFSYLFLCSSFFFCMYVRTHSTEKFGYCFLLDFCTLLKVFAHFFFFSLTLHWVDALLVSFFFQVLFFLVFHFRSSFLFCDFGLKPFLIFIPVESPICRIWLLSHKKTLFDI